MSHKSGKIAALIQSRRGQDLDPHYLGFFDCFNQGLFFEAHEVLEEIWLPERGRELDRFYKGLIQLAGAFVHLQKGRPQPSMALLRLARTNLQQYPSPYERLDVNAVLALIDAWIERLEKGVPAFSVSEITFPSISLLCG
jgi:predicted metal-dependent hydrolase